MKKAVIILVIVLIAGSCRQVTKNNEKNNESRQHLIDINQEYYFKNISEITQEYSYSVWFDWKEGYDSSLSLIFGIGRNDTLSVYYSNECWLYYPYKLVNDKIIVYWDTIIDTKYQFDIVKAIDKIDKKLIGKPFMILELEDSTTLKATYPMKDLIEKINLSSENERIFFPDRFRQSLPDYNR